jgi:hypothetical protein
MSKKLKEITVMSLSSQAALETFSAFGMRIERISDEKEYRLKGPCVSSKVINEAACEQDPAGWIKSRLYDLRYNSCFFIGVMKVML